MISITNLIDIYLTHLIIRAVHDFKRVLVLRCVARLLTILYRSDVIDAVRVLRRLSGIEGPLTLIAVKTCFRG